LDNSQLTIEQSATLVEFQDDAEATEYLTAAKTAGEFDHRVSELRHKAAAAAARVEASGEYQSQGYTVLDQRPQWNDPIARHPLHQLCSKDGKSLNDDVTSEKPELWAVWLEEMPVYLDSRSGEIVDEHEIDWDIDREDLDAAPEGELIHPRYIEEATAFDPTFYCLDPAEAGLITWEQRYRRGGSPIDETEEASAKRKEAERREKRKVVALNKLGLAAQEVRQAWVKDKLLNRKTPPKGVPPSSSPPSWPRTLTCSPPTTPWTTYAFCSASMSTRRSTRP
jgi:ParB family chromosome partitioning protein